MFTTWHRMIERRFLGPSRAMKASHFEQLELHGGEIVFLGDSITEGGQWHEWFPGPAVANRGIGGDTSTGVLKRLHTATAGPPSAVLLLIGTNDLSLQYPIAEIAANVDRIVTTVQKDAPDAQIVLQSVMPRKSKRRGKIEELNDRYREIAHAHGIRFLDLWPALADEDGALRRAFTLDDLHLNGAGYRAWVEVLRPVVEEVHGAAT